MEHIYLGQQVWKEVGERSQSFGFLSSQQDLKPQVQHTDIGLLCAVGVVLGQAWSTNVFASVYWQTSEKPKPVVTEPCMNYWLDACLPLLYSATNFKRHLSASWHYFTCAIFCGK